MTIAGVGPITAPAMLTLAPPIETFSRGQDFAAWLGLTLRQQPSGRREKLGSISRMGERTLRRLLIIGSSAVVLHVIKCGAPEGLWLEHMLARKPRMLVTVALPPGQPWLTQENGGGYGVTVGETEPDIQC